MKDQANDKFTQQLKSTLDQSVQDLSEDRRYQLQLARGKLLDKEISPWRRHWVAGLSMASIVAISLFALVFVANPLMQTQETDIVASIENNIFEDDDNNIEFYEELDFYVWLSNQETNT